MPAVPLKAPTIFQPLPPEFLRELLDGVGLGDHEKAGLRLRALFEHVSKEDQRRVAEAVFDRLIALPDEDGDAHIVTSFLEAIAQIDNALAPVECIEQLVASPVVVCRMGAAMMLWDLAETSPGTVPIDLVARLAKPATEDWARVVTRRLHSVNMGLTPGRVTSGLADRRGLRRAGFMRWLSGRGSGTR